MLVITVSLAVFEWRAIDAILGYPKQSTLSALSGQSATLYWTVVQEPTAIYLWVKMDGADELCSYKFPYSRPLHKEMESAKDSKGDPVRIMFGGSESKKGGADGKGSMAGANVPHEIYVLPPPIIPPKVAQP